MTYLINTWDHGLVGTKLVLASTTVAWGRSEPVFGRAEQTVELNSASINMTMTSLLTACCLYVS